MGLGIWISVLACLVPAMVSAGSAAPGLPEPDVFALFAAGAVALAITARLKKK